MGNTDAKAGSPSGSAKERKSSMANRILKRGGSRSCSKDMPGQDLRTATDEEVSLAKRLAEGNVSPMGPPFYAVSSSWLSAWSSFALAGGAAPGPIANGGLVNAGSPTRPSGAAQCEETIVWLSADDWHLLHRGHGGGPVLCRAAQALGLTRAGSTAEIPAHEPKDGGTASSSSSNARAVCTTSGVDSSQVVALVRNAAEAHAVRCQKLGEELASQIAMLEKGPWAKKRSVLPSRRSSDAGTITARQRLAQAVATDCGGEELRAALQDLREAGDTEAPQLLEPLVAEICVHEEAQIVLACLLQALEDSDRMSLELWLEQAEAMGLDRLLTEFPHLLGPLNKHKMDLEESEKGALQRHAHSAELRNEGPSERMWRLSISAFEDKDEATLMDLVQESQSIGLDVSAVELLLEELREQRAATERASRPTWAYRSDGREQKQGGPSRWNDPSSWATPGSNDWKDPSAWSSTEDFLDAWRRWKHQDRVNMYGAEEAERMRREEDADRDRSRREEEERRRKEYMDRERQRQYDAEDERRRKTQQNFHSGYAGYSGGYGGASGYRGSYTGGGGGFTYGSSYGQRSAPRPPPASSSTGIGGTQDALRALGFPPGRVPSLPDIKAAYKKAAMRAHPDRPHNRGRQEQATAEFQKVKAAFDMLAEQAPLS